LRRSRWAADSFPLLTDLAFPNIVRLPFLPLEKKAAEALASKKYDLIILDEICTAMDKG